MSHPFNAHEASSQLLATLSECGSQLLLQGHLKNEVVGCHQAFSPTGQQLAIVGIVCGANATVE